MTRTTNLLFLLLINANVKILDSVITYASLTLPTALAFYWIVTYAFIAVQNIIINKVNNKDLTNKKKDNNKKDKIKDKLVKKEGMKYGKDN